MTYLLVSFAILAAMFAAWLVTRAILLIVRDCFKGMQQQTDKFNQQSDRALQDIRDISAAALAAVQEVARSAVENSNEGMGQLAKGLFPPQPSTPQDAQQGHFVVSDDLLRDIYDGRDPTDDLIPTERQGVVDIRPGQPIPGIGDSAMVSPIEAVHDMGGEEYAG